MTKCCTKFKGQSLDGTQRFEVSFEGEPIADVYLYPVHPMYFGFDRDTGAMIRDKEGEPIGFAAAAWAGDYLIEEARNG